MKFKFLMLVLVCTSFSAFAVERSSPGSCGTMGCGPVFPSVTDQIRPVDQAYEIFRGSFKLADQLIERAGYAVKYVDDKEGSQNPNQYIFWRILVDASGEIPTQRCSYTVTLPEGGALFKRWQISESGCLESP